MVAISFTITTFSLFRCLWFWGLKWGSVLLKNKVHMTQWSFSRIFVYFSKCLSNTPAPTPLQSISKLHYNIATLLETKGSICYKANLHGAIKYSCVYPVLIGDLSMKYTSFRKTSTWAELSTIFTVPYERQMRHRVEAHGTADRL